MKKLFGTDGIRGEANEWPITPEVALRVGRAVARVLSNGSGEKKKVVIGKDTRLSGYMLETALTSGLVSEGARVLLTGPLPTPAVAHLTQSMACDAGIMLTASHNPFQDNGIKIFGPDGYKLNDELEVEIEKLILAERLDDAGADKQLGKAYRIDDATGRYIEFAKNAIGSRSLKGLKIVVDCAHGASYFVGPLIFEELGAEVIKCNVSPDGRNINADCGALYPEKTAALVVEHGADLGVCFDGDADRVIFIDANGEIVSGDRVLCLCAIALKQAGKLKQDTLVATVMSNLGLRDGLDKQGIKLETTGVGDRLVIERMREKGFSLGGENSGHIIFADSATTGDGIMSALHVLGIMKSSGKPLAELAACMEEYPQELHGLKVKEKPPIEEVPELKACIDDAEKLLGDKGRILVRYSGTEKKIRVLVEAQDAGLAKQVAENICGTVKQTIGA
ncbi:phosphoglucosamine mutase [Rubritalea halochordaticola]|uniref:Phosphoglucosamine mutase n=1 Tax=Rubritalea halochordaticola TaxID=714537 RepID=A0ABP9V067_9BACT